MDSFSILCDEFTRLRTTKQDEEIGKLFTLLGGIRIKRYYRETDEDFRNRTFAKGLDKLPGDSEYEGEFFENRIIPSLINDFKHSSVNTQGRLMEKLSGLTVDELSNEVRFDETARQYRIRFYSRQLRKLPPGSENEMVEFARQVGDSDGEADEDSSDEEPYNYSTRSERRSKSKSFQKRRDESSGGMKAIDGSTSRPEAKLKSKANSAPNSQELATIDTVPVEAEKWNDGSKRPGFNQKLKFKTNRMANIPHPKIETEDDTIQNSAYRPIPSMQWQDHEHQKIGSISATESGDKQS